MERCIKAITITREHITMPPFLSKSFWIDYSNYYDNYGNYNSYIDNITESALSDLKDEYGYLPSSHTIIKDLKRLIRRYAPDSYENEIVSDNVNLMNIILENNIYSYDRLTNISIKINTVSKPSGKEKYSWYNIFKKFIFSTVIKYDLFTGMASDITALWGCICQIREAARWELEPALTIQIEKESKRKIQFPTQAISQTEPQNTSISKVTTIKNTITLLNLTKDEKAQLINELKSL